MTFYLFRFFINIADQQTLFGSRESKAVLIKEAFSNTHLFESAGNELAYMSNRQVGNIIHAKLGKKSSITRRLPPEQKFEELREEDWPYSNIFINISGDPKNGQIIAFETGTFTNPSAVVIELIKKIDHLFAPRGLAITVNAITKQHDFWKIAKENVGRIEELKLTFATPNLFELQDTLSSDLKAVEQKTGANSVTIGLTNKNGTVKVSEDEQLIKQGVDYIANGGGSFRFKIKGRSKVHTISSDKNIVTKEKSFEIEIDDMSEDTFLSLISDIVKIDA